MVSKVVIDHSCRFFECMWIPVCISIVYYMYVCTCVFQMCTNRHTRRTEIFSDLVCVFM